ncbi:uncharacterized protein LOC121767074 [Salvia splendens]|uniref:uncharacterized protein LOC121767074 n=1 Tax=Salvia splendens TaxID=180675 RepID=UPI001C26F989|nr:uncharacterized protein LOC121767074 [Salvia splendens]
MFSWRKNECPYEFLNEFSKLCSIQKRPNYATEEDYRLRAIPFALKGEANTWLLRLPQDSICTWGVFTLVFLDYFFPSNKINALKNDILECKQDYDESLSHYWSRFKGLLDACPNHRMIEAETFYLFYEGANPELIDAKKAYDNPRNIMRRGSANAVMEQGDERVEVRIDRLEKALLNAIEKSPASQEIEKTPGPEETPPQQWSDNDPTQPPPQQNTNYAHPPERQSNWSGRNQEGQNNWGNRNQGDHSNCGNRNQNNQGKSYVPPHQRNNPGNYQNSQPNYQGNQGPGNQYNNNSRGQRNFRSNQGNGPNHSQGSGTSQPNSRSQRSMYDMVHDLVSTQQRMQSNLQSNNDVVHKLQDAQMEHKAAMDVMAKQLSQITTSLSVLRGNEGKIPATVKPPDRENISQITLRSGHGYEGPTMKVDGNIPLAMSKEKENPSSYKGYTETGETRTEDDVQTGDLGRPLPRMADPFFLDPEPKVEVEKVMKETGEYSKGDSPSMVKQVKPFPYGGEAKKKKDEPVDFMDIFGKLEINLSFLQALKLPIFSKFFKEFIVGKTKPSDKILIGENVSVVIQKPRMPSKHTDPGMFTLPISNGDIRIEHAMCDQGASINVLPLFIYKRLVGVGIVDTKVVIQLADRSCICPEEVLENVIVKVHDFLYRADFHVIKMSENESAESSGVLLGRPFLRTANTIIDVFDGTICLDYHGEKYTFSIDEAMKKPLDIDNSELSHSIDREVAGLCEAMNTFELTDEELVQAIVEFCRNPELVRSRRSAHVASMENLPGPEMEKNPLPQAMSVPKKELKTLPPGLKYAYLEENEMFPVIVNSNLT